MWGQGEGGKGQARGREVQVRQVGSAVCVCVWKVKGVCVQGTRCVQCV